MIAAAEQLRREIREGRREDLAGARRRRSTHAVEIVGAYPEQVAVKVFRSCPRREAHKEWAFLQVAKRCGHRLAPSPIWCDLDHELPAVAMTRVPGSPLGEEPLSREQLAALATLLQDLYARIQAPSNRANHDLPALDAIRGRWPARDPAWPPVVRAAHGGAGEWLAAEELRTLPRPSTMVMGRGDCNLANFLWAEDDSSMFHVDFEDSGGRALAVELADLVEHLESRHTPDPVWTDFVAGFHLSRPDRAWHAAYRRLYAVMWLLFLFPGGPASTRNPPGTLERQAERVLALLG